MTIIEAVKNSIERVGCAFLYHADGELNELVACEPAFDGDVPVALCYLLGSGSTDITAGVARERVNIGVFFSLKTNFDFDAIENERLLDVCKKYAQRWLLSLNDDVFVRLVSLNSTERVYDTTTDILTAYAVNVTLEQVQGQTLCGFAPVLKRMQITKNGEYDVTGYDKADVNVLPTHTDLVVTKNGTYLPKDYGVDAFDKVEVNAIFGNIEQLQSTETAFGDGLISNWSRRADLSAWDTSKVTSATRCFLRCYRLIDLRVDTWNTSNFTDINNLFSFCTVLPELNVDNWDTSKVTNVLYTFEAMYAITTLNLSKWNMMSVNKGGNLMFSNSENLKSLIGYDTYENDLIDYDVICLSGFPVTLSLQWQSLLHYTSMLAVMKGLADITGAETPQTITFNSASWKNVRNDDDTIPSAKIIAERQAYLSSIAAEKGWTLIH